MDTILKKKLSMGENSLVSSDEFFLSIEVFGAKASIAAIQLNADGRVRDGKDVCVVNQNKISGGAVSLFCSGGLHEFEMCLSNVANDVVKLLFTATLKGDVFNNVSNVSVLSSDGHDLVVNTSGRTESTLILAEVYRRNNAWKIRNVSQGFNSGVKALNVYYGVSEAMLNQPLPNKNVSLSKLSLTKAESTISLKKSDGRFGLIRVNLNWNQKKSGGVFGIGRKSVDLDIGALIEFKSGHKLAVQALGNAFGSYDQPPFVFLRGDDRSGAVSDGEWLDVNGNQWAKFHRVLIYAFIYEGVANWQETNGVIRLMVPGQPEVEVHMNEVANSSKGSMCAVAMLENIDGEIRVTREVKFFGSHSSMDECYGWGMKWRAGSK